MGFSTGRETSHYTSSQEPVSFDMQNRLGSGDQAMFFRLITHSDDQLMSVSVIPTEVGDDKVKFETFNTEEPLKDFSLKVPIGYRSLSTPVVSYIKTQVERGMPVPGFEVWNPLDDKCEKVCYKVSAEFLSKIMASVQSFAVTSFSFEESYKKPKEIAIDIYEVDPQLGLSKQAHRFSDVEVAAESLGKLTFQMPVFANDPSQVMKFLKNIKVRYLPGFTAYLPIGFWDCSAVIPKEVKEYKSTLGKLDNITNLFVVSSFCAKWVTELSYTRARLCNHIQEMIRLDPKVATKHVELWCQVNDIRNVMTRKDLFVTMWVRSGVEKYSQNPFFSNGVLKLVIPKGMVLQRGKDDKFVKHFLPNIGVYQSVTYLKELEDIEHQWFHIMRESDESDAEEGEPEQEREFVNCIEIQYKGRNYLVPIDRFEKMLFEGRGAGKKNQ